MEAAGLLRESGDRWSELALLASSAHPAVLRHAALSEKRSAELDTGSPDGEEMRLLAGEQAELVATCDLSADDAVELFGELARPLGQIVAIETEVLTTLDR